MRTTADNIAKLTHFKLHTVHCALRTAHDTQHTEHNTQYTTHRTLNTTEWQRFGFMCIGSHTIPMLRVLQNRTPWTTNKLNLHCRGLPYRSGWFKMDDKVHACTVGWIYKAASSIKGQCIWGLANLVGQSGPFHLQWYQLKCQKLCITFVNGYRIRCLVNH